jgi:hypothetical protein
MTDTSYFDDLYFITPMEMVQNPTLGPVRSYVFGARVPAPKQVNAWLTKTGLLKLFDDLETGWEELLPVVNARGSFLIKVTPEQRAEIEAALDDMTMLRSYAIIQKQNAEENANRYETVQRRRYAQMMAECAEIREAYPDLK